MTERLLIVGLNPFDSGKTEVSLRIAKELMNSGRKVEFFKPLSGHSYWYKYEHTKICIKQGELFSNDAWRLKQGIGSNLPITIMNPIHNLFVPARIDRPRQILHTTLMLSGWDSVLAMKRLTQVRDGKPDSMVLVAEDLVRGNQLLLTTEEMRILIGDCRTTKVSSLEEMQSYQDAIYEGVLGATLEEIEKSTDFVIIESFNDSVWPWTGLDIVDNVIAVGPGHVFLYDPEKIKKAVDYADKSHSPIRAVTMNEVTDLLRPRRRFDLHPESGVSPEQIREILVSHKKHD